MYTTAYRMLLAAAFICVLVGCTSQPVAKPRPHEFIVPPPGKAVAYFLVDWPSGSRSASTCSNAPAATKLNVEGMVFAEMRAGSWTYLLLEPVAHNVFYSRRQVTNLSAHMLPSACGPWQVGNYGNGEWLAKFVAKPDGMYFFAWSWDHRAWQPVDNLAVRRLLDLRPEECIECAGRPFKDRLRFVEPPTEHFLSPKRDKIMCLQGCYERIGLSWERCKEECAEWFEPAED